MGPWVRIPGGSHKKRRPIGRLFLVMSYEFQVMSKFIVVSI